ncbi:MAG: hypothetical protein JWM38_758, partial [Sphingomonas bacterium]|nr:hypothetical protein [Sphingomonas bacterium]
MSSGHGHTNQGEGGEQPGGIRRPGGEFKSPELERAFRADHQAENRRHANTLLIASTILNGLFLAGDWQFHGGPDFAVTIMARAAVIVVALVALLLLRRARSAGAMDTILIGWMAA